MPPTTKLWLAIIRDGNKTQEDTMGFMQRLLTGKQNWLRVETTQETVPVVACWTRLPNRRAGGGHTDVAANRRQALARLFF